MKAPSLAQARFLKRIGQPLPMTWDEAANQITEYLKMNAATNIASPECNLEESPECAASPTLIEAAQQAAYLLSKIPAFGDSIGTEINKAQCGMALRALVSAIQSATQI